MLSEVACDDLEVVSKWLGDHFPAPQHVAHLLLLAPYEVNQGLKDNIKYDGGIVVAGEDPLAEVEDLGLPLLGDDLALTVQVHDVGDLGLGDVVVPHVVLDELMWDRAICVTQVKPGEMRRPLLVFCYRYRILLIFIC